MSSTTQYDCCWLLPRTCILPALLGAQLHQSRMCGPLVMVSHLLRFLTLALISEKPSRNYTLHTTTTHCSPSSLIPSVPIMKNILVACVLPSLTFAKSAGELCRGHSQFSEGNWYCSEVQAITYKNISQPGRYNRTTRVNPDTGLCDHEPVSYSGTGSLTPLFGEVTWVSLFLWVRLTMTHSSQCISAGR